MEACAMCNTLCNKFCSKCKKAYYCCVDHQKEDRKAHKKICFPAKLEVDEVQGRHFVATKNISPGDPIFSEKALVVGPSGAEKYFHKICLGCYRVVRSDYLCSKCKWPVCNPNCEKLPPHSETECKVFSQKKVLPHFKKPYEYDFIKFLRTLLLRESDGKKWKNLCQLASHREAREECEASVVATVASFKFITETCGLTQYGYDTVSHVVGIWGVNSFGANAPSGPNPTGRLASFLFAKTSLCSHNCVANTRGILMEGEEEIKLGNNNTSKYPVYTMELLASRSISEGKPILITYAEVGEGSYERQKTLRENYYFQCKCERCKDPTEFGTNFSAIKCNKCKDGYLLPVNPLDEDSDWNCNTLKCRGSGRKYYDIASPVLQIKFQLNSIGTNDTEREITEFERILMQNSGRTLHSNHWILMEVKYRLIQRLICFMPEAKDIHGIIRKCIAHSQHCLEVADVIRPGHNPYRGKILYCLCQAKLQQLVRDSGEDLIENRASLVKLKHRAEEAYAILSKEPTGSDERTLGDSLKEDLIQIQRIISMMDMKIKRKL